jgi:hypothetical protein
MMGEHPTNYYCWWGNPPQSRNMFLVSDLKIGLVILFLDNHNLVDYEPQSAPLEL